MMTTLKARYDALKTKHADELATIEATGDMSEELYQDFYKYYLLLGEIPYGTAKARDGDPYQWVFHRLTSG